MAPQKMDIPLISIIVPVYKTPTLLLRRFLESALGQSIVDLELIAVDDASEDDCTNLLDAAASRDMRMTVIHRTENGRAGMARNDGLRRARGEYILFSDADDMLRPDMCEKLLKIAHNNDADIVACSWSNKDQKGNLLSSNCLPDIKLDLNKTRQRALAYRYMKYMLWNKIFRLKTISRLHFEQYEANIGEDVLFNVAALCCSHTFVSTSYCGYDYTVHKTSSTGRPSKGISYLRTIVQSGDSLRQVLFACDGSKVGKKFADVLTVKRFITGLGWIADQTDYSERSIMWTYWYEYLNKKILPVLHWYKPLALWCWVVMRMCNESLAYRLSWTGSKIFEQIGY